MTITSKKLLSLPLHLVDKFHALEKKSKEEWFCASDPPNQRVGSGGGTAWLLKEAFNQTNNAQNFSSWLSKDRKIIIHAGGQSRRLPAYASVGKILTPIPVFRWSRGQKIDQNLLSLQLPFHEQVLSKAPKNVNTLIASGDVYLLSNEIDQNLPEADIICLGMWVESEKATNHGVFICDNKNPNHLKYMLQKPEVNSLQELSGSNIFLMDVGVWLLSDKAVRLLMERSGYSGFEEKELNVPKNPEAYDLYAEFGLALGSQPKLIDEKLNDLSVAIVPLPQGEFYHYGTSKELISSTVAIQNRVVDQRSILHKDRKPHPSIFTQNAQVESILDTSHQNIWIENAYVGKGWKLNKNHLITGVPFNQWECELPQNTCLDFVPIDEDSYCIRLYGFNDKFRGEISAIETLLCGVPFSKWLADRNLSLEESFPTSRVDIQSCDIFPVLNIEEISSSLLQWMIDGRGDCSDIWKKASKLSPEKIMEKVNLQRSYTQREDLLSDNIGLIYKNHDRSVFNQIDLDHAASIITQRNIDFPLVNFADSEDFVRIHEQMFLSKIAHSKGRDDSTYENKAFELLRTHMLNEVNSEKVLPSLSVHRDQIVWGRSPVRIDFAGGWSDTAPYCIFHGGSVVNVAIELNGQPPLQVFIKPSNSYKIILRSIDMGSREDIETYEQLAAYNIVGSAFSIPKAALCLVGFLPAFSRQKFTNLSTQLKAFGCGIEISTLAAIPKGSGLGTSSVLSSTVLGALSDFCGLNWSTHTIGEKTLLLEQLLTTGGGWQDQFGGLLPGIKLLQTESGFYQSPSVKWAPNYLFTNPEFKSCMLLYYTGITRTAKDILGEIVKGMFLNKNDVISILAAIKKHGENAFQTLQENDFTKFTEIINTTWEQKKQLDSGTNPPAVQAIINQVKDYLLACKLPGAGGGGYLYMIAKDPMAAVAIKKILENNRPNSLARFVDISLSENGFQVTKS